MRKLIAFAALLAWVVPGTGAWAGSSGGSPEVDLLDEIGRLLKNGTLASAACALPDEKEYWFKNDADVLPGADFCDDPSGFRFCMEASLWCGKNRDLFICRSSLPKWDVKRQASEALRARVNAKIASFFYPLLRNPDVHATCCGDDQHCIRELKKTQFVLVKGVPSDKEECEYQSRGKAFLNGYKNPVILCSESMLMTCFNEQCVERTVLHELGHACQYARHVTKPLDYLWLDFAEGCRRHALSERDLAAVTDAETARCIVDGLRGPLAEHNQKSGPDACLGSWLGEAFAETVFHAFKPSLTHWAWECEGEIDKYHGPIRPTLDCLLKYPPFRSMWCGSKPVR